jgi:hypothetical protein
MQTLLKNEYETQVLQVAYTRPPLYPKQEAAIFCDKRLIFIEASTKSGKTHGALAWIFEKAITGRDGGNYWWVAPVYGQARIAFLRLVRSLRGTQLSFSVDRSNMIVMLPGERSIFFKSGDRPDNLYGEDVDAAVIDEASRLREDSFVAVRSTLTATRGPLLAIGNVRGRKNWFWKLCRRIQRGNLANAHYAKLTAIDAARAGVLAWEEVSDAKTLLSDDVFRELYMAIATEDGANPFGMKNIAQCTLTRLSSLPAICYGVDLARTRDYSCIVGLDMHGQVCYFDRFQRPWVQTVEDIVKLPPDIPIMIDATGVGDAPVEYVQKSRTIGTVEGFKFTKQSKQPLVQELALSIAHHDIWYPASGIIRSELDSYEFEYTRTGILYSAPEGEHDDAVIALALANRMRRQLNTAPGLFIGRA